MSISFFMRFLSGVASRRAVRPSSQAGPTSDVGRRWPRVDPADPSVQAGSVVVSSSSVRSSTAPCVEQVGPGRAASSTSSGRAVPSGVTQRSISRQSAPSGDVRVTAWLAVGRRSIADTAAGRCVAAGRSALDPAVRCAASSVGDCVRPQIRRDASAGSGSAIADAGARWAVTLGGRCGGRDRIVQAGRGLARRGARGPLRAAAARSSSSSTTSSQPTTPRASDRAKTMRGWGLKPWVAERAGRRGGTCARSSASGRDG